MLLSLIAGLNGRLDLFQPRGDLTGFPLLLREAFRKQSTLLEGFMPLAHADAELIVHTVTCALAAGLRVVDERLLASALDTIGDPSVRERARLVLLDGCTQLSTQQRLDERHLSVQRATRMRHDPGSLAQALRVLGLGNMPDYSVALESIAAPEDMVVGEQDEKFRAIAERMAKHLPRSRLLAVPKCGHNVVLERPEALAAIIGAPCSKN